MGREVRDEIHVRMKREGAEMKTKHRKFCDMTLHELVETLVAGRLPDGRRIDLATRRASLARALPMLRRGHDADRAVATEIGGSPGFKEFLGARERDAKLIAQAEGVCNEALNRAGRR